MLNFTLTITAAPELLAVMKDFINSISAAKVAAVPELLQVPAPGQVRQLVPRQAQQKAAAQLQSQVQSQEHSQEHSQVITQAQRQIVSQLHVQVPVETHKNAQAKLQHETVTQSQNEVLTQMHLQLPAAGAGTGKGVGACVSSAKENHSNVQQHPSYAQGSKVPTAASSYTLEQLAAAATELVDAGRRAELIERLSTFGVQALTALPKEQYGTFAAQLKALGATL